MEMEIKSEEKLKEEIKQQKDAKIMEFDSYNRGIGKDILKGGVATSVGAVGVAATVSVSTGSVALTTAFAAEVATAMVTCTPYGIAVFGIGTLITMAYKVYNYQDNDKKKERISPQPLVNKEQITVSASENAMSQD